MTTRRYAVGGISQASNSFCGLVTNMGDFVARGGYLERGRTIPPANRGTDTVMGGFLAELDVHADEVVPTLNGYACPGGPLDLQTYEKLRDELVYRIVGAGSLDGVLLTLHGAMLADGYADPEGDILQHLRRMLGGVLGNVPIAIVLDPRANVSEGMVELADVVVIAKPHVPGGAAAAGAKAARLLRTVVESGSPLHKAFVPLPLMVPGFGAHAAGAAGTWARLERQASDMAERDAKLLELGVIAGFPYADTPCGRAGVLACSATSAAHARQAATSMARASWAERRAFLGDGVAPEPTLARALRADQPSILLDVADDPASGGAGDTPTLLRMVLEHDPEAAFVGVLHDPDATAQAFALGKGSAGALTIGGRANRQHGEPVVVEAVVETLSDGIFVRSGPTARGKEVVLGRTALLRVGRVRVAVSDGHASANDPALLRLLGVDPASQRLLVLKARGPLRDALGVPGADEAEVEAPGAAPSDVTRLPFAHLVRPIFPLDPDAAPTDLP